MIYFAHDATGEAVKIGTAHDPMSRVRSLQTGNPRELVLLGQMPGGPDEEAELHERFRDFRLRGEWFRADAALLAKLAHLAVTFGGARTVADELARRSRCRYGLRGVQVAPILHPEQVQFIASSRWGADSHLLLRIVFALPREPPQTSPRVLRLDELPPPEGLVLPASACVLASVWPIVCRCWCPAETDS